MSSRDPVHPSPFGLGSSNTFFFSCLYNFFPYISSFLPDINFLHCFPQEENTPKQPLTFFFPFLFLLFSPKYLNQSTPSVSTSSAHIPSPAPCPATCLARWPLSRSYLVGLHMALKMVDLFLPPHTLHSLSVHHIAASCFSFNLSHLSFLALKAAFPLMPLK